MSYDVIIGEMDVNYTFNMQPFFHHYIKQEWGETDGIPGLHKMKGKKAAKLLSTALCMIQIDMIDIGYTSFNQKWAARNGWGDAVTATLFLTKILDGCVNNPKERVKVFM